MSFGLEKKSEETLISELSFYVTSGIMLNCKRLGLYSYDKNRSSVKMSVRKGTLSKSFL